MKAPYDKKELLTRISEGDDRAFTLFFQHYQDRVYNISFSFLQSSPKAEDVVQDVFLKIWANRHQLATIEFPDSWVATIARNYAINSLRKIAREEALEQGYQQFVPAVQDNLGNFLELKDLENAIAVALTTLSENQRIAFELSQQNGMKREEIAELMQLSPNTVKMHLLRANKYIRAALSQKFDGNLLLLLLYVL